MAERMLGWVKPGGHIFFRESCFHQSGDSKRKSNPTHYREPRFYTKVQSLDFSLWNSYAETKLIVLFCAGTCKSFGYSLVYDWDLNVYLMHNCEINHSKVLYIYI